MHYLREKIEMERAWWITLYNIIVMSYYYCCIYTIYYAPTHDNIALYDIVLNINAAVRILRYVYGAVGMVRKSVTPGASFPVHNFPQRYCTI